MAALATSHSEIRVPRIELSADGIARVTRWGMLDALVLRAGDRLVAGSSSSEGLLLLVPRGRGRPMLGTRQRGRILALPGHVPVSDARWRVDGSVVAIERQLERGAPSIGSLQVVHAFHPLRPDADLDAARRAFSDGPRDARQLDADCLRATLAPRRYGVALTIAAAPTAARAAALLSQADIGTLIFVPQAASQGQVIQGPWTGSDTVAASTLAPSQGQAAATLLAPAARGRRVAAARTPRPDRQVLLPFRTDSPDGHRSSGQ